MQEIKNGIDRTHLIRLLAKLNRKKEEVPAPAAPPAPSKEEVLLTEIRDLLKEQTDKK